MKKFLLLILALCFLSFSASAYGADVTLTIASTEIITSTDVSYYVSSDVSGDPDTLHTAFQLTGPYQFTSVKDAVEFANGPLDYIAARSEIYDASIEYSADVDYYANIAITLNVDDCLGGTIHFDEFSNVTEVAINTNEGASQKTFSNSNLEDKHFYLDSSLIKLTLDNIVFNGGSSKGGIVIGSGGSGNFSLISFDSIPGAVEIDGGSATFEECSFHGNNSATNAGAINIINCTDATIRDCHFWENSGNEGGAVNISNGNSINFTSCDFTYNTSSVYGGAVNISGGSDITFSTCEFTYNHSDNSGGAINLAGGDPITFSSCTINNNNASTNGGAISITGNATVTFSTWMGNLEKNFANNFGGAVYMSAGNVTFNSTNPITNNSADKGGAIYVEGGSSITFSASTPFTNNTANTEGGAIYINASSLTPDLSNLNFENNVTINEDGGGGALYLRSPAIIGGKFENNHSAGNGGAVYINNSLSSVTVRDTTFRTNSADKNGGAIYMNSSASFEQTYNFLSNQAANGGAVYIVGGNPISFSGTESKFTSNTVLEDGGAIYINGGSDIAFLEYNTFTSNSAQNSGGAVYINNGSNISFADTAKFEYNYSPREGGAITINSSGNIPNFSGVEFNNNSADNQGGTIAILDGGAEFDNETSFKVSSSDKGGALYIAGGTVTISGNTTFTDINGNDGGIVHIAGGTANIYAELRDTTATNGGAIYMSNGTANIYGKLINNTALENGGAICMSKDLPIANIHNNLESNRAINGGAIFTSAGTITISGDVSSVASGDEVENILFKNNYASSQGGAIYINGENAEINILGNNPVVFETNHAGQDGGAIYAYKGTISNFTPLVTFLKNYTHEGSGGALYIWTAGQVPDGNVIFDSNESRGGNGGAIFIGTDANETVTLDYGTNYTFTNNIAGEYGGAIYSVTANILLDGFSVIAENHAEIGGGFASSGNGRISITNYSSISNQWAPTGGAFYAPYIYVTSSDLEDNYTKSVSGDLGEGGGAIFATSSLYILGGRFFYNRTEQESLCYGGAVYLNGSGDVDAEIINSLFDNNSTRSNGGAVALLNTTSSTFENDTFKENTSGNDGGAVYVQGDLFNINKSYFESNRATSRGGAAYFVQLTDGPDPTVNVTYSMFKDNNAAGEGGGALFIGTTNARIDSCTFTENFVISDAGNGGALYLMTRTPTENLSTIDSCTFYKNTLEVNREGDSGGGAVYLSCEKARMRSCTFTLNSATGSGGGAIYLDAGTLTISGTIAIGNANTGLYDIRLNGASPRILTGGYNRIGKFSQGSGETDFKSVTGNNDSDRTSWVNKRYFNMKESFFRNNDLAKNQLTNGIPPKIGSALYTEDIWLLTLMLNEAETLPVDDRATNAIPYFRRGSFPTLDERGAERARVTVDGEGKTVEIALDIGAVVFDPINTGGGSGETAGYSVKKIQMSGVPTEIRRVGQTASLVAKVYYTNGREAYGGTGENEEPVKWSSDPSDYYVHVDENTGDLVALRTTSSPESSTYVTITVETVRTDSSGNTFKDSQYIKITDSDFTYLNTSPLYSVNYLRELINDFIEYNIGFGLADISTTSVTSSTFQNNFARVWNSSVNQVSDLTKTEPRLTTTSNYQGSNGYKAAKTKGVTIDFDGRNTGDIFPVVYTWNFTGDELIDLMSRDLEGIELSSAVAEGLFRVLKLEFQGTEKSLQVIGSEGVSAKDAYNAGVLVLNNADGNRGVQLELTAYIANVSAENSSGPQLIESDGSKLLNIRDYVACKTQ